MLARYRNLATPLAVIAAVIAIPFGVLMALPAVRLQGLYLALATMAFALLAEQLGLAGEAGSDFSACAIAFA